MPVLDQEPPLDLLLGNAEHPHPIRRPAHSHADRNERLHRAAPLISRGRKALAVMAFPLLWIFIGTVSCYDAYLILKYQQSIFVMEMNPIGCWLLAADHGEPSLFLAAKFQGTIVVLGILQVLHRWDVRWAHLTAGTVAAFQAGLLAYLTLALPA